MNARRVAWRGPISLAVVSASLAAGSPSVAMEPTHPSPEWRSRLLADIASQEYEITFQTKTGPEGNTSGWQAPNRAHGLRIWFAEDGLRVEPREPGGVSWEWGLSLLRYGRAGRKEPVDRARLFPVDNRVDYDRGALVEGYANGPRGLEQRFTLPFRPDLDPGDGETGPGGKASSDVHVDLSLWGTLHPAFSADGRAIDFKEQGDTNVLRYARLRVEDARGLELPSRMEGFAESGVRGIRLVFDDQGAVYPVTLRTLTTSPAWTAEGNQAFAHFGLSVATAGDVNGDGYSDVIVGAHQFDNGEADEGKAFVYLGSASGLAATPAWSAEGDQGGARFGRSVAPAGDVNADGYSDVIVGAHLYNNVQADEGRAFVYHGSASGLAPTAAWTAESDQALAEFGFSVGTAGDVNGDGYSDVIVGAYRYDNGQTDEGRAYVYLGSASGLLASPAWTAESDQVSAFFGRSVATAGDANADRFSDVIVGAHLYDNGQTDEGRAYVYLGSASGVAATPTWTAESNQVSASFGFSTATAGDVNGDGYSDVVVGAYLYDNGEMNEGRAYVHLGSASGPATTPAWTAESHQTGAQLGRSVAPAGDINGDGYADVIVGAYLHDNGESDEGRAFVYLGSASGLATTAAWTAESDQAGAFLGESVATAGDVNGDGYSDVIVGAHQYDNGEGDEGRAFVYLGSASGLAASAAWTGESDQVFAGFGIWVATAGDVNGDGYSDVIVGASRYDNGQAGEGRAFVYHGSASGLGTAPAWSAEGDQADAQFGDAVATAGDVNGDGYSDVIVGADQYDNGQANEGRAFVYLGSASGLSAIPAWTAESDQALAFFGAPVATAGDVNGDGYSDVIVGASSYTNGETAEGRAFVYHGSASGPSAAPAWTAESDQAVATFGWSVATAGDVNGDGYSDVIVGAVEYDNGHANEGRAFLYLGSATGLAASPAWTAESDQAGAYFGWSVGTAGDVNGDGYSEVIVGAPTFRVGPFLFEGGAAFLYYGSAIGTSTLPAWTVEGQVGALYGTSVATAGDVNGDGYSDVIVGAPLDDNGPGQTDEGRAFVYLGSPSGLATAPAWTGESNQAGAWFGLSVATGGDVNGDGTSDVVVGVPAYDNGQTDEGLAVVYYGSGGDGLDRAARQARADGTAPIDVLGRSDSQTSFRLRALGRSAAGRSRVRLQWEVEPLGIPFDGNGLQAGSRTDTGSPAGTGSAVALDEGVGGLAPETVYHWRMRILSDSPFFPASPWLSLPYNNRTEADLRTLCAVPTPPATSGLSVGKIAPAIAVLGWGAISGARGYDVTKGDLAALRTSGGNFTVATLSCLADQRPSNTGLEDPALPAPSGGFWYLVRAVGCLAAGTYDTGSPSQQGSRDAEIGASALSCP